MVQTVLDKILMLKTLPMCKENEAVIRDGIQNLFLFAECAEIRKDGELKSLIINEACLLLRSLVNSSTVYGNHQSCDLWEVTDEICLAADLYLCCTGKRLIFTSPEIKAEASCSPDAYCVCLLNLISNAYLYSSGEYIGVTLEKIGGGMIISVSSDGKINLQKAINSMSTPSAGLWKAKNAAASFGGKLFLCNDSSFSHSTIFVPCLSVGELSVFDAPDFSELLCDRCSPVNIQLSVL